MKRQLFLWLLILALSATGYTQNVFNPDDPIVRYDASKPYGSAQRPDTNEIGLQKWVSKPTTGVSQGVDAWDASSFKQYFIHVNVGTVNNPVMAKMAFRIKFPKSYKNPDSADKKYPIDLFLHGGGEVGCTSNGGLYNNEKQLWLGGQLFMQFVDQNKFDGFLVYPQLNVGSSCFFGWGSALYPNYRVILAMIDSLSKYARADIDRVLVTGLSGGGYGAWEFAENYPQRIAKIIPSAAHGLTTSATRPNFVHIPIWFATGGLDPDPDPTKAAFTLNAMKSIGADIRYTQFPERGHSMWYQHWREPDFPDEMNDMHKANPLVFFQHNEFCDPAAIDAKLGITQGFNSYEWQKDGQTIATRTGNTDLVLNPAHVIQFEGNNIRVRSFGTYRVRFKRTASSEWSDWSHKPVVVKSKSTTQTAAITVRGAHSKVLPALDGSTTVPLMLPDGFQKYEWFTAADEVRLDTNQVYNAPIGLYKARYQEEFGCGTNFSPDFVVVDANGSPKPAPALNVTSVALSENVTRINWTDDASNETGFEVYRATASGGPYTFVALTQPNATSFRDSNLVKNTVYYYVLRSVNETGASVPSNEGIVKTFVDNIAPTAPSNLDYDQTGSPTSVELTWTISTDQGGIERYDIYVNGEKKFSTNDNDYTATGLDSLIPYRFTVIAVDSAGNVSPASNQVTYLPPGTPSGNAPAAPASPAAEATAFNKITISWTDASDNETGFEIVRSLTTNGTYKPAGTVAANVTSFSDSGLAAAEQYFYRVRAIGEYGQSDFSPKVDATTPGAPSTPIAPSDLAGVGGINNSISISWTDNSGNENNFIVYRSTDGANFTAVATLPANTNAFTDTALTPLTDYYYYVAGSNGAGEGGQSNRVVVRAGNNAPVISAVPDLFVKATTTLNREFTVTDDANETITVTIANKPGFIAVNKVSDQVYRITAAPGVSDAGSYVLTIMATDNSGKSSSRQFTVRVGDKYTKTVYVNFGAPTKTAAAPWNNWMGRRGDGDVITNLKDETNTATTVSVTTINGWDSITTMGHISGDNSGAFPDSVLASGLLSASPSRQIKIGGLTATKQYNIVLLGSQNEGYNAAATYSAQDQTATLNSRYNTDETANLNNLVPDANGEILVTITRSASPLMYLSGMAIEEVDAAVQLLSPNNLYAEALDRNSVKLTWSDRTKNEANYELVRATDSGFTKNVQSIQLPANTTNYTNSGLAPNTKYWFSVRARNGAAVSEFSPKVKVVTPETTVFVDFNVAVENGPAPWNSLESSPLSLFTISNLRNQSNQPTNISLSVAREFNGEFTSGMNTGDNSGIAPDRVLQSNYWLDNSQLSQIKIGGLNHGKVYRFGFIGSSGPDQWFKGNYTAKYTVNGRNVYLNSWFNSTKIVYINNVMPDPNGNIMLNFSTSKEGQWGFNAGIIIDEYDDEPFQVPVDTLPGDTTGPNNPNPPDTTDPNNPNPPDTTGPNNPNPPDTTGPNNPNPPDTTGPNNPNPPDTTGPNNPNPPDTTGPNNPNPPDTTGPNNPNPPDTTGNPNPVDTLPYEKVTIYPNPVKTVFNVNFYNRQATDIIDIEVYDQKGERTYRRNFGTRPAGSTTLQISSFEAGVRSGVYLVSLKINGEIVKTLKLIRLRY